MMRPNPQGFYFNGWGADTAPDKAVTAMGEEGALPQSSASSGHSTTTYGPQQGDKGQHDLRKTVAESMPKAALTPRILDSQSTEGCSHIKNK